jgi:hypothetical protein
LRADEIAFVITRRTKKRQMIAGLSGPGVRKVVVRLSGQRTWTPPSNGGAFFGTAPPGQIVAVVKVVRDGTREVFAVHFRRN